MSRHRKAYVISYHGTLCQDYRGIPIGHLWILHIYPYINSLWTPSVQCNGQPLAIFQPSDAVDRLMQPMVGHLCHQFFYNCNTVFLVFITCIIIHYLLLKSLPCQSIYSMLMCNIEYCTLYLSNYRLWLTVKVITTLTTRVALPRRKKKLIYEVKAWY